MILLLSWMAMACPDRARCVRVPVQTSIGEELLDAQVWYEENIDKEPLYFVVGGPGQAGTDASSYIAPFLHSFGRSVVFFSPLGTQKKGPFPCDSRSMTWADLFGDIRIDPDCIPQKDFAVEDYGSIQNIHYLNTIREYFHHERIVLLGSSYGSRIAQLYVHHYPQHVSQLILDSGLPLDAYIGVSQYAEDILNKRLDESGLKALENIFLSFPVELDVFDSSVQKYVQISIDKDDFFLLLHRMMYRVLDQEKLNTILWSTDQGDWSYFVRLAKEALRERYSLGTYLSVFCQEDWKGLCAQEPDAQFPFCTHLTKQCSQWPIPNKQSSFAVKKSTIPTLVLHGAWDHISPVSYAKRLQDQLGGTRVEFLHEAHGVSLTPCGREVIHHFLHEKTIDVHRLTCRKEMHIEQ